MTDGVHPYIQSLIDAGYAIEIVSETGGSETHTASAIGPGATKTGQDIDDSFDASSPGVTLPGGLSANGGGASGSSKIAGLRIDPQDKEIALIGVGSLLIVAAAVLAWKGPKQLAFYVGVAGACVIAGAFYPLAFLGAAVAGVAWIVYSTRASVRLPAVARASANAMQAIEDHPDATQIKRAVHSKERGNDERAVDWIKRTQNVKKRATFEGTK